MSYETVVNLRTFLTQFPVGAANDAILQGALDEATDIIDAYQGFSYAAYGVAAAKDVRTPEYITDTWDIPAHEVATPSSVTALVRVYAKGTGSESTQDPDDWTELADGRLYRYSGWDAYAWYRITAKWGKGPAPDAVVEVCRELAINLIGARDSKQISDVVGVEGAVGYNRSLTNRQKMTLDACARRAGEYGFA